MLTGMRFRGFVIAALGILITLAGVVGVIAAAYLVAWLSALAIG